MTEDKREQAEVSQTDGKQSERLQKAIGLAVIGCISAGLVLLAVFGGDRDSGVRTHAKGMGTVPTAASETVTQAADTTGQTTRQVTKQTTVKSTAKTDKPAVSYGDLVISCTMTNAWEEGGKTCSQFEVEIKNNGSSVKSGWKAAMRVPAGGGVFGKWNCEIPEGAGVVEISPMEYNREIPAGGSVSFGFQIKTDGAFSPDILVQ